MSYQGDDPNRRRERQQTGTPRRGQPQSGGGPQQPPSGQQPPQQSPPQQPPAGQQRPQQSSPQQGHQGPPAQQPTGFQPQQGTQPQGAGQFGPQGAGAAGQTGQYGQGATSPVQPPGQAGGGAQSRRGRGQRARLSPAEIEAVVSTDVVTAERDTPLSMVAAAMDEHDVGSVVVVEDDGETPVGIVTDRKIALAVENTPDVGKRTAEDLVSGDLLVGTMDMTVFEALEKLSEANIRRLPVVDEEGSLAGIVTLDDLIVTLGQSLGDVAAIVAAQTQQ